MKAFKTNPKKYHADLYHGLGNLSNDFRNFNLTNLIASKIRKGDVLDIGCGNGYLLGILGKKGIATYGIEPNKELITLAKRISPKARIFNMAGKDIYKLKRKFDAITMLDVLEHIEDDKSQLKKVHERLREKGKLILVVPCFKFLYGKRDENNGHYRRYSKKELLAKLDAAGFRIKELRYWNMLGFFPYFVSERLFDKELNTGLRTQAKKGILRSSANRILNIWFKNIENKINFGFGLSLICIAEKI